MKEKLIIKNFGPIKSVNLDLGKIMVLIGEQATGKSTIAKVLSICRYFSYIVNSDDNVTELLKFTENKQFFNGLKDWGIEDYLKKDSYFFYKNNEYEFEFRNKLIIEYKSVAFVDDYKKEYFETQTLIKPKSNSFKELLHQLQELKRDDKEKKNYADGWMPNENFFRLNVKKVLNNPFFIPTERGFQSLSVGKDSLVSNSILDELAKINRIVRNYKGDVNIKPLELTFRNKNGLSEIKNSNDDDFYFLHKGASGYQSIVPIVLTVIYYSEIEKRKKNFIVEEPELNLFPSVQKKLMQFLVESINKDKHSFIIPTHSPYFLTSLNNLIYANKLGNIDNSISQKAVENIIPKKYWIDVNDISVYFLNNGEAKNLINIEECLINLDDLDSVSEIINKEFDELLEMGISLEKEI